MGCGCGTNKTNEQAPKTRLARAKESIRNVWEKTQIDQPKVRCYPGPGNFQERSVSAGP